ncbi:MAG: MMPL family transporter [Leptospiraceae bacterium]|nr:MMPL family transporter [Leptospiraceae bacterium]
MRDDNITQRFSAWAARFWPFWLYHVRRFAWPIIAILVMTSVIGYRYGRQIRIDTNLLHLLPSGTDSLERLTALRNESHIKGFLVLTLEAATPQSDADLVQTARKIETMLKANDFLQTSTNSVIYEVPGHFLQKYSLYYADYTDLAQIRDRLANTIRQTKRSENPYFEDLEQVAPAKFYIGDILNKYRKRYLSSNAFIDNDHRRIAMLLSLKTSPDDIQFSQSYLSALRDTIEAPLKQKGYTLQFSGRYASDVEKQKRLASDISQSTTITLLILTASLIVFFRSLRVMLVIGLPVLAALGYTYFAAWYFIGQISIISSFLTSILLGLGIDYGIHLFSRYKGERLRGHGMTQALEGTMRNLFRGLSFGMISTAAVFLTLSFSRFIAFAEFGKIAFAGIIFFFLAFILFFPALIFLTEKYSFTTTEPSHMLEKTHKIRGWHIALIIAITGYGTFVLTRPPFEYDFFELEHTTTAQQTGLRVLENREHMVVYSFDGLEKLRVAEANLRKIAREISDRDCAGEGNLAKKNSPQGMHSCAPEFHSVRDLIPEDAARKYQVLSEIHALLKQAEVFSLVTLDSANLRRIRFGLSMTESPPVTIDAIPLAFRQHLVGNGRYYLYVFPKDARMFRRGALDFAAAFRETCTLDLPAALCPREHLARGISDLYVLDDILGTVMRDLLKEIILISAVIAILVLSMTRRLAGVAMILAPLIAGILGLFALIGVCHQLSPSWLFEFNYINLLAIPILLGVGIDNGIYLYSHAKELGLSQVNHIMISTGGSIFISNFTTAMGFLSLTISSHIGLASFGFITFAGMLCVFYSYRILFPALSRFFEKLEAEI